MRRLLFISFLFLLTTVVFAQKVSIKVSQTRNPGLKGWTITDRHNVTIYSGNDYVQNDSVMFSLNANEYYFFKINAESSNNNTPLLTLSLNKEPLLCIRASDLTGGKDLFPFFTGVKGLDAKITGGTGTDISAFPWQVYFIAGNYRCGGSIINKKWVITAAHCTFDDLGTSIPVTKMFVRVGLNNPSIASDGKTYSVSEAIVHEGFNSSTLLNDIALLKISDSINYTNATPINIVTSNDVASGAIDPGVMSWVTGWGYTHVSPYVVPTALQKVQLPIISNAQASTVWSSIPATDIMAGYLNGNKDACNGDSGGPLVVPVLDGYRLAGLVSWGSSQCNTYGAYTNVSDFEDWISSKTGIAKAYAPPAPVGDTIICQGTVSTEYSMTPVTNATSYEWKVLPSAAGMISWDKGNASVLWDLSYSGSVTIIARVTVAGVVSDWSRLYGTIAQQATLSAWSADTVVCAGNPVTLSVTAEGYDLGYTWYKNNQVVQSGSSPEIVYKSAAVGNTGEFKCVVTSHCNVLTSKNIELTVYPVTKITSVTSGTEVSFGDDITLEVVSEGHNLTYQWQKDNAIISGGNSAQLPLTGVNANNTGIYRVTVEGTCGTEISDSIYIYIKRPDHSSDPEVYLWPSITNNEFAVALNNESYYNIQIFNILGEKIRELPDCSYKTTISISNLSRGVYIVRVYNSNFSRRIKIIRA